MTPAAAFQALATGDEMRLESDRKGHAAVSMAASTVVSMLERTFAACSAPAAESKETLLVVP